MISITKKLPGNCGSCIIQSKFCDISTKLKENSPKWTTFALKCGNLDEIERIRLVESVGLNKVNREQILDETYAAFFSQTLLYYPFETLKRVLTNKFENIFPEYKEDLTTTDFVKWTLRIEVISKFCQLSEILAGHLLASKTAGTNYKSYRGYAKKIIQYSVGEAIGFFNSVPSMTDADLITIMCYPDLEKQAPEERSWLLRSIFELRSDLESIGEEYKKFKDLYNAYKHGCRLLHPLTTELEGSNAVGNIIYLTPKSAIEKGGEIKGFQFPTDDFTSFFYNAENLNRIMNVMLTNRKGLYYYTNKVSENVSLALYFQPLLTGIEEVKKDLEFIF